MIYSLSVDSNLPWVLLCDFNYILFSNEKVCGNLVLHSRLFDLRDCIEKASLHDLVNYGLFFTWFNMQKDNPIHAKLDRVMCNSS